MFATFVSYLADDAEDETHEMTQFSTARDGTVGTN